MGQELVKDYQDLKVYQIAFEEAMQLYWLMPQMSLEDEDLLGQQLVEASRSVCANLAEAWKTRQYYKTFVAKLNEVEMKVAAVQTWLAFAVECGYLEAEAGQAHHIRYGAITWEINGLIEEAMDWAVGAVA